MKCVLSSCIYFFIALLLPYELLANRTVDKISDNLILETFDVTVNFVPGEPPTNMKGVRLWLQSTPESDDASATMRIVCNTENPPSLILCFNFNLSNRALDNDQIMSEVPGNLFLVYQLDEDAVNKEYWPYNLEFFPDAARQYNITASPPGELNESAYQSGIILEKMKRAQKMTIVITLESGIELKSTFDVSSLNKGLTRFNSACENKNKAKQ